MSSNKTKEVNEKHDKPDSTTMGFDEGDDVFVSQKDGTFHFGTIAKICVSSEKCLVKFGDGQEYWSPFKHLKPCIEYTDECSVCKSSKPKRHNEIVLCEECGRGYHQECHKPIIKTVKADWKCKSCLKNCQLPGTKKTAIEDLSYDATANTSSNSDPHLAELPPTPPSSGSAPETPQPSIVNGDPPTSPIEDRCCDFNDSWKPIRNSGKAAEGETSIGRCLNLDDLLSPDPSKIPVTFPLNLNPVITDPLLRITKRQLIEKDFIKKTNGEVTVKRRRIPRRQSSLNNRKLSVDLALAAVAAARPSTSSAHSTPVKIVPNGSTAADLKSVVYGYYNDETKVDEETNLDRVVAGEEYRICGKRRTRDGKVEYLIDWVKCTKPL